MRSLSYSPVNHTYLLFILFWQRAITGSLWQDPESLSCPYSLLSIHRRVLHWFLFIHKVFLQKEGLFGPFTNSLGSPRESERFNHGFHLCEYRQAITCIWATKILTTVVHPAGFVRILILHLRRSCRAWEWVLWRREFVAGIPEDLCSSNISGWSHPDAIPHCSMQTAYWLDRSNTINQQWWQGDSLRSSLSLAHVLKVTFCKGLPA